MDQANVERLHLMLRKHAELSEEKRLHPELAQRQHDAFQDGFKVVVRSRVVPVLEEVKDVLVGRVESVSIFHGHLAAGLRVKLDRWEDYERSLLFYGDHGTRTVRVTHEGIGFGLLSQRLDIVQITAELVEEELMKFLKRLFADEQLRRPALPPGHRAAAARPSRREALVRW
jgi:hypothetical protein